MAKFNGQIGYASDSTETPPGSGIWVEVMTERTYQGDVIREARNWNKTENLNDNLTIQNRISVVADDFARTHFSAMKYVIWSGVYWKISSIEVQRPRFILSLGGVYNGPKA